jgi:hypothetical protein
MVSLRMAEILSMYLIALFKTFAEVVMSSLDSVGKAIKSVVEEPIEVHFEEGGDCVTYLLVDVVEERQLVVYFLVLEQALPNRGEVFVFWDNFVHLGQQSLHRVSNDPLDGNLEFLWLVVQS